MISHIHFSGPVAYRARSAAEMTQSILEVSSRRMLKGPRCPGWNWFVEVVTRVLRKQVDTAFHLSDVAQARIYLNSIMIRSPALSEISTRSVKHEKFRGTWFSGRKAKSPLTLLYLHGGGYSFYPRAYASFIAQFTLAAKSRTFALDYRLTPEHRFPAQIDDALAAYRWMLDGGIQPDRIVIGGDSAGGNLTLALLLKARDLKLPQPAMAIALSPPTDFESENVGDEQFDWITKTALLQWRDWYCAPLQRSDPLISPVRADLRGLAPMYIQAGRAEILYESIQTFADRARSQGADLVLETWEDMNHNFPVFGPDAPQSVQALRRIGEVVEQRVRRGRNAKTIAC